MMELAQVRDVLERVGLGAWAAAEAALPSASRDVLGELCAGFVQRVPFEQLDVALGRGRRIDLEGVLDKVCGHGRGGTCLEINQLLLETLRALGFAARPVLARVLLRGVVSGLTHMIVLVSLDGQDLLCDVGFGLGSLRGPVTIGSRDPCLLFPDAVRLRADDGTLDAPGALRLQRWEPSRWEAAGRPDPHSPPGEACWADQYVFHPARPMQPRDAHVANWWTSEFPGPDNWFTNSRLAVRATPTGWLALRALTMVRKERVGVADLRLLFGSAAYGALADSFPDSSTDSPALAHAVETSSEQVIEEEQYGATLEREFGIRLGWNHNTGVVETVTPESYRPGALLSAAFSRH
jgi:N-hydroxyarylamine O-acetyltransferase